MTTGSTSAAPGITCPHCGAAIPPGGGYVTWCDACDWNVDPSPPEVPTTRRGRREHARIQRDLERARDHFTGVERLRLRDQVALAVPVLIAFVIFASTTLVFLVGVAAIFTAPGVFGIPIGALLITLAVILRPRLGRLPRRGRLLRRHDAPELFRLLDDICDAARSQHIDVVVPINDFNAAAGTVGLRRRRVVWIGLPLWFALDPQPRVAVLGHEVAHFVNGDIRRGVLVGSSIATLSQCADACELGPSPDRYGGIVTQFVDFVLALVALVLRGVLRVQLRLTLRSHRVAEHAADELGATIASTAAAVEALDTSSLAESWTRARSRSNEVAHHSIRDRVTSWRAELPPRERERLRRLGRQRLACADESHPPTAYRIDALLAHPIDVPNVTLDADRAGLIDAELLGTV